MSLDHIKDANNSWSVVVDNQSYRFDSTHMNYVGLVSAVREGDGEGFVSLLSVGKTLDDWSRGQFLFKEGHLYYNGEEIHEVVTNRIVNMINEGFDHLPMLWFLQRLYKNPSYRAIKELYQFLAHSFLPITSDGHFLGYKYVTKYSGEGRYDKNGIPLSPGDYVDCYTGKSHRNNVGDSPSMPRHQVDDNFENPCGQGLHVGSREYSAGVMSLICKVDPANVVSVPKDHDAQKIRTCGYTVVEVFDHQGLESSVVDDYDEDVDEDVDEDEYGEDYDFNDRDEDVDLVW